MWSQLVERSMAGLFWPPQQQQQLSFVVPAATTRTGFMAALPFLLPQRPNRHHHPSLTTVCQKGDAANAPPSDRVFVAGATGKTGRRIVKELLARGAYVRAGVRDPNAAKAILPVNNASLEVVQADVTESAEKLAAAIGDSNSVICATGFRPSLDFLAPWKVDNYGTVKLVDACKTNGVGKFVLVSSILVNGAAMGQLLNPAYIFLNVFGLTLIAKLQAENYIRKSGIDYTIIRPGGLKDDPPSGNIVMASEDTLYEGSISRESVAFIAVEALALPEASYKVVEIISTSDAPLKPARELFAAVK